MLGSPEVLADFVARYGITFTILGDLPFPLVTKHYGIRYWSEYRLLDRNGNLVGESPALFDVHEIEELLAGLEQEARRKA